MSVRLPHTDSPTPGYYINDFDPLLIRFPKGWVVDGIHWYGLAYVAGVIAAAMLLNAYYKKGRTTLNEDDRTILMTAAIAGTVIGGRLGYIFGYMLVKTPRALIDDPLIVFKVNQGGMASHGGMIGIGLATWWCSRRFKIPFLRLADLIVTLGPPGVIFGRFANFINGELWGRTTDVPWAVVFKYPDLASRGADPLWLTPRHPSQLYAMVLEGVLLTAWTQFRFWKKKPLPAGQLTGEFMVGYAIVRIIGEFWREPDEGVSLVLGMSRGQFYSVFLGLAGLAFVWWARRRDRERE